MNTTTAGEKSGKNNNGINRFLSVITGFCERKNHSVRGIEIRDSKEVLSGFLRFDFNTKAGNAYDNNYSEMANNITQLFLIKTEC